MKPTDAELEILHHLWQHGPLTVRMVNGMLNEARKGGAKEAAGYTTTLKLMQIMLEKGLLSRTEEGRTHTYSAVVREEDAQSMLLQQFVNNTFRGNTARLVMQALGNQQASADELDEIKALIATLENKEGDDDK